MNKEYTVINGTSVNGSSQLKRETKNSRRLTSSVPWRRFVAAVTAMMLALPTMSGMLGFNAPAFADDLVNTVPADENYDTTGTVTTYIPGPGGNASHPGIDRGNSTTHSTTTVRQSQSTTAATTFAAGAPLSTICIDQSKINMDNGTGNPQPVTENISYKILASNPSFAPGLTWNAGGATVTYNPNAASGLKQLTPGAPIELDGDLYEITVKDAAVMPDGNRRNLKVTFSNAKIFVDERLKSASTTGKYNGAANLSVGVNFYYGGDDSTAMNNASAASGSPISIVDTTAKKYGSAFTSENQKGGAPVPILAKTMDATYQIVDDDGIPVAGTFVLAFAGINIDRDPYMSSGNNTDKVLWYFNENYPELDFFSESIAVHKDGLASDYIYVRSNNNSLDDNEQMDASDLKNSYYYPYINETNDVVKITANQDTNSKSNTMYSTGFITVADSGKGITVTGVGHGGSGRTMQTSPFASTTMWYRYTSSTGDHGNIQITSEGNYTGELDDGGDVLGQGTYVVTKGKTVTYTMTPDIGYKLKKLEVNGSEVTFNGKAVSTMKKGDSMTVTTAAGKNGTLTYKKGGTYTLVFPHAEHDEAVHVEWEPTTADILVAKVWDDENDKDGLRAAAYANEATKPKVKLQWFVGGSWEDVPASVLPDYSADLNPQVIPDGKNASNKYRDGRYEIDRDTTGNHPYTWEYLPVYSYDNNGVADRLITYRIVEDPDLTSSDYKAPEYFDGQSFTLDASMTKSRDGFQLYTNGTTNYIKKGDGKYYEVDGDGNPSANPAATQPAPSSLTGVTSNSYYTVDKGTPYQTVDVKNEHKPYEIYIQFTKNWNDAAIQNMVATDGNQYARKDLHFTLHGTIGTNGSTKIVDLNGDEEGNDIVVVIPADEADTKAEATGNLTIDGQEIVTDGTTNYVLRDEGEGEQYYTYTDNTDDTYTYTVADPQPATANLNPIAGDRTYKIDDYNFGALIENLPTHSEGKLISYTLTETDSEGNSLDGNGWIVTGGQLTPGYDSGGKLENYTTEFVNTPVIDDTTSPLPITIQKKDGVTKGSLEGAVFTVYTNAVNKTKASESATEEVGGQTVYTDGTTKYVLRSGEYYTYKDNGDGTYTYTKAANQDAGTMRESQLKGAVDENEVVTNANGQITINFNEPGIYYVVETKAPTGYEADPTIYTFEVDKNLKSVTLKDVDAGHDQKWWEVIYELLFGNGTTLAENWAPSGSGGVSGTLTVKNDPIRANILINKVWDDNNNQDGLRDTSDLPKVKLEKTTNPADDTSWTAVNSQAVPAEDKDIPDHDAPITVDPDNYYTWGDLPAYENGKLLYYRVVEFDGTLPAGGVFLPSGDHPEEVGYAWTALTATGNEKEFNIANVTDPDNPTSRNRTVTVRNKHVPQTFTLNVSKDWADDDNDTSKRKTANITLYKTIDGVESIVTTRTGVVPDEDETNFTVFENLPVYENGKAITYRIEETAIDHYGTTYKRSYETNTAVVNGQEGDSIDASAVKRTFGPETIGDYPVYTDESDNQYAYVTGVEGVTDGYYAVSGDTIGYDTPYTGDTSTLTATRTETTEAEIEVKNAKLTEVTVEKTWFNGATENVIYRVYRTTSADPAVTDWEQAKGQGTTSTLDDTKTVYNWNPENDGNWELVLDEDGQAITHAFPASDFANTPAGDTKDYTFQNLPVADPDGKTYTYRAYELGSDTGDKFEANQVSNTKIENTNTRATDGLAHINVVKELEGREWNNNDKFYFQIEPYEDGDSDSVDYGHDGACGVDQNGNEITDCSAVPLPKDNNGNPKVIQENSGTQVGAIGRNVGFAPITYTSADVDMGKSAEYYYKVYEVYDAQGTSLDEATEHTGKKAGITYDGEVEDGIVSDTFKPTEHFLKVVVTSDPNGVMNTALYWDGSDKPSAVPVYTNRYDAVGTQNAQIDKYIMGRDFEDGETFTFTVTPLGDTPMVDATTGERLDSRDATLTVSGTDAPQSLTLPNIKFILDDLPWTVGANGATDARDGTTGTLTYSDDTTPVAGMKYGRFMYAFTETGASATDLNLDPDTEYVQVTVIDKGDGTLDTQVAYFEDRYGTVPRYTPNEDGTPSTTPATATVFVNKLKRDLSVTKAWDAPATSDVTLKLQWSTDGTNWNDADGTDWLADFKATQTIDQDATANDLTVKWENLPAYAPDTDDIDLNDKWIRYRVVENEIANVTTRYSTEPYANGDETDNAKYSDTPIATEAEDADTSVSQIYVTNFVDDLTGTASVNVVKQLIGRGWTDTDSFGFTITPVESKIGKETTAKPADERAMPMPMSNNAVDNTATATTSGSRPVTVGEYNATFKDIVIKLSDLALNDDNIATGEFIYTIKEVIPEGAEEVTGTDGKTYYVKGNIKYTGDEHTVKIVATNDGTGTIDTTVSYDDRPAGDFVPVYTNEAIVSTPIAGTKTWVGGEDSEHINANAAGVDALGIELQRKTSATNWETLTEDDAKRDLVVVWEDTEGNPQHTGNGRYVIKAEKVTTDPDTGDETTENVDPVLDTIDNAGYKYEYRIIEGNAPDDYAVTYATTGITNNDITNTSTKKDRLKVTKVWEDSDDAAGLRPDKVIFHLYKADGTSAGVVAKTIAGDATDDALSVTWTDLPVYDKNGDKITYKVVEEAVAGYTTTYDDKQTIELDGNTTAAPQTITVTNSLTPETSRVDVTKVWNDANNQDGLRGEATVTLYKQEWNKTTGQYGNPVSTGQTDTLSGTKLSASFEGLTAHANGKPIVYSVLETRVPTGYTAVITGDQVNGFTITNTHAPATIDIQAKKRWNDSALQAFAAFGYDRPKTVSFQLKADGTAVGAPVAVSESSEVEGTAWAYKWAGLPKYKNGGQAITYTVEELAVPDGYTATYAVQLPGASAPTNEDYSATNNAISSSDIASDATADAIVFVKNTPGVADKVEADIVLHKIDSVTGKNIAGVEFELKKGDTVKDTYTTDAQGVAHINFSEIATSTSDTYTLTEKAPATGYQTNDAEYTIEVSSAGVQSIELEHTDKNIFEKLYDLIVGGDDPDYNAATHTLTVKNTPTTNKVTVSKTFVDDKGNAIPESLLGNFEIKANYTGVKDDGTADPQAKTLKVTGGDITPTASADGKTYTWEITGVAYGTDVHVHETKYFNVTGYDFKSTEVTTSASDAPIPGAQTHDDDASFVMPNAAATVGFINTYAKQTGDVELVKNWSDDSNRDRARPPSVEFTVTASAPVFGTAAAPSATKTVTLTGETTAGSWSESLTDLPLYYNGTAVTYTVDEAAVSGYTKAIGQTDGVTLTQDATETLSITNSYTPKTDSLTVKKMWDDDNDAAGLRPNSVTFHLYKTVSGGADVSAGADAKTVNVTDNWTATWTNLPVYENGEKITYKVVEEAVAGYNTPTVAPATIKLDAENGAQEVTVTNELVAETTEVTVTKNWNDNNNQDGLRRPATVTLRERVWNKTSGQYGTETDVDTGTLSVANDATVTFSDLPAIKNGKPVMYSVVETQVPNYEAPVVTGNQVDGFTITNTHTPAKGCVEVQKIWDDNNNQDGKRTDVTMTLKSTIGTDENANTIEVGSKVIPADMNKPQEAEWHNLPVFRDGQRITYTVEETGADSAYRTTYSRGVQLERDGDTKTLTVTNEYTPAKTTVTATKVWADNNNQDGMRADVILHLKGTIDGSDFVSMNFADKTVATGTDHDQNMTATWENLPVYHDGKAITYTVTEEAIPGYTAEITGNAADGFTVTNSHPSAVTSVTVTKEWNDGNNVDGTRKVATVTLYKQEWDKATGQYGDAVSTGETETLAVTDNATVTFENLTANANGKPVMYSVVETQVEGYDAPVVTGDQENGFTITNTHTPETINIQATKVWDDAALMNGTSPIEGYDRPKTVSLQLKADGTAVGAPVAVSKTSKVGDTEWAYLWSGLPKYKNGGTEIAYTVEELEKPDGYTVTYAVQLPGASAPTDEDYSATNNAISSSDIASGATADATVFVKNTAVVAEVLGADLVVKKVDKSTGKPMEGVTFTLTSGIAGFATVTQTTNDGGVATFTFDKEGEYTLTETVPAGYENPDPASYTITVSKDGASTHVELEPADRNVFQKIYDLLFNGGGTGYDANTKMLTVENTPKTNKVTVTKTFVDDKGNAIPESLLGNFEVKADYTGLESDGTADLQVKTLKVTGGDITPTASADGKTYTWEITGVAYGTDVHVHEMKYFNVTGYDFVSTAVTASASGAQTHDDDASFVMPNAAATVGFINTYAKQTGDVELVKNWNDDSNRDGKRPTSIEFTVTASAPVFGTSTTKTVTLTGGETAGSWSDTSLTDLPLYDANGNQITYTLSEDEEALPEGYSKLVALNPYVTLTKDATETLSITNTYMPKTDSLKVTKAWSDNDNAAGLRPDKVVFHLYKSDDTSAGVAPKIVSGNGSATWENLPVYDKNGNKITYKVVEEAVTGYETTYSVATVQLDGVKAREATQDDVDAGNAENVGDSITVAPQKVTVTNELTAETTSVTVTKVWDDANNVDGTRPGSVSVDVYEHVWDKTANNNAGAYVKNTEVVHTFTLDADGSWTGTKSDLPATKNGKPVFYTVGEDQLTGYEVPVITGDQINGFTVTNKRTQDTVRVTVNKTWEGDSATYRPDHVVYTLKADGGTATDVNGNIVSPATALGSDYGAVFTNLPKNKLDSEGTRTPIAYTVEETALPGYTTAYADPVVDTATGNTTIAVTNTAKLGTLFVTKTWNDENNRDGKRPSADDFKAKLSIYADGKQVTLGGTAADNGDNTFTVAYTGVPVYNANNQPITYMVAEGSIADYTQTGTPLPTTELSGVSLVGNMPLANTYEPEKTDVSFTKQWNDASNQDGARPSTAEFADMLKLTSDSADDVSAATPTVVDNGDNTFTITYSNLYKKWSDNGTSKDIVYTLTEKLPNGSPYTADTDTTTSEAGANPLKNSYTPATASIKVTKVWDDGGDQDDKRPDTVTVRLLADGTEVASTQIAEGEFTFTTDGDGTTGTPLPVKDNGRDIVYTVTEDAVADYQSNITGTAANGYVITNSYKPGTTTVTVTKVWDDANDQDGLRPDDVTIKLFADDTEVASTTIAGGSYTFTTDSDGNPLPAKKNGTDIVYTVSEEQVSGYNEPVITGNATTGFTVTNTHTPATTSASVTKIWVDDNNADGLRPNSVTFQLYKTVGGTTVAVPGKTITLTRSNADANDANKWAGTIEGLPEKENNQAITYSFKEVDVPAGYSATTAANGLSVTNTHERHTGCVEAVKVWADDNNREGKRTKVTFALLADGQSATYADGTAVPTKDIVANINEPQAAVWHNLPVNDEAGKPIVYAVVESGANAAYTTTMSYSPDDGVTITKGGTALIAVTNTYAPTPISVTATKVWKDNNNQDGMRANVTLHLKGTVAGSNLTLTFDDKTIAKDATGNNLTVTWTDLPAYHDGKAVTYSVSEEAIPGYTATVTGNQTDGFTVTNERIPAVTSVSVTKVWNDADNQDGLRRNAIVHLDKTVDGTLTKDVGDTKTLVVGAGHEQGMTAAWDGLPAYENGRPIAYSVREEAIDGYTTQITGDAVNGFTITNTHVPETIDIQAIKVWDDAALMNGTSPIEGYDRPKTVSFQLKADGTAVGAPVAVSKSSKVGDTEWAHQWTALPKYKNGGTAIAYTVEEVEVPYGYTAEVTGSMADGFTVTNTPNVAEVLGADLVVKKVDKSTGKPMEGVTFTLTSEIAGFTTVTQTTNDGGVATFTFDKEGEYTLTETVPTGYENPDPASYTITVSKDGASTHVELEPADRNVFQKIYDLLFNGGGTGYDANTKMLTVENTPKTSDVTVRKQFVDADTNTPIPSSAIPADFVIHAEYTALNENGVSVEKTATLKVSDAAYSDGTYRWVLEGVAYGTDVHVHEMKYFNVTGYDFVSTAVTAPAGAQTHDDDASFTMPDEDAMVTFANAYTKQTGNLELVKNWGDDSNRDRARPQNVSFTVTASAPVFGTAAEPSTTKIVTLTGDATADSWSDTSLTGLPLYHDGAAVTYTVDEATIPEGHTKAIGQPTGVTLAKGVTKTLSITNTYASQTDSLTVTKAWSDSDDAAGLRPDKVIFHLYKEDGTSAGVDAKTVSGSGSATWAGLPVYDANGTKITYKVVEEAVPGYTTTYGDAQTITLDGIRTREATQEDVDAGLADNVGDPISVAPQEVTVTNSLTAETTSVRVTKVWDDGNNVDNTRKQATVTLYKQEWDKTAGQYGNAVNTGETKTLTTTNGMSVTFEGLTAHANGKPIIYSVVEEQVEGYDAPVVAGDQKNGFTITNTHAVNTRTITVTKAWNDAGMSAANYQRPKDISVNLFANGTAVGQARGLSEGNSWSTSWTVPVNDADGAIEYVVKELNTPTGYTYSGDVTVEGTGDQSVTITNTAKPSEVENPLEITVKKTNLKGELLEGATFTLEGPDNYSLNATSNADGRFTLTFPKDGTYTLTETAAPTGYKVNNEPITIKVGKQLSEINLQTGSGLWANIYNLFVDGTPEGWDAASKTLTLTNEPKTYTINAYKYLDGINTLPSNFAFELTYTDAQGKRQVVTNTSAYTTTSDNGKVGKIFAFHDIPFDSEVSIRETGYEVTGKNVGTAVTTDAPGAVTTSDSASFTMPNASSNVYFTNTYVDTGDVTIPVAKVWNDADNQDSKRPDKVTFRLFAGGKDTGKTVTLSASDAAANDANRWAKADAFTVPGFDDAGKPITYTVREDVSRELATAGYTDSGEAGADKNYTITNTLVPDSGDALGDETWGGINEEQIGEINWNVNPNNPVTPGELVAPAGATVNSDGSVAVADGTYKLNSDGTITFTPKANWHGDPTPITVKGTDRQGNEVTATYTPHVVNNIQTDEVKRTITYSYAEGNSQAAVPVTQTVTFTRTGTVNPDTGEVTYKDDGSDWTVVGGNTDAATFAKVDSPDIEGYNPDRKSVPAVTVKPGDDDITEKIVYSDQVVLNPREITVVKVDSTTDNPLAGAEFTLSDPYGTKFKQTTGTDGKATFRIDAEGGWTLVETGVPEDHKLGSVYSWTIVAKADENNVTIEKVTEGEDTLWKKIIEVLIDLTAAGYDANTATLTVKNPPIGTKTITYVNPNPKDASDVTTVEEYDIKVGEDEHNQPNNPTRSGYNFGGWLRSIDPNTGNVTYTANWIEIPDPGEKEITYIDPSKPEGEQIVFHEVITRGDDESPQPGNPTRDGWKFVGWKRTIDDKGNVTYTATWEEIPGPEQVMVTYDPANGEDARTETINRNENEPAQPGDPTRTGFTFMGWQRVEDTNGNVTYTAKWKEIPDPTAIITITHDPGNGEPPRVVEIERGQNEPAQPGDPMRDGYEFSGWDRTVDTATGNVIYKARWKKVEGLTNPITITYDPANGENLMTTTIERGTNEPGQPGPLQRDGFTFGGWLRQQDPETGNVLYTANWIENTCPQCPTPTACPSATPSPSGSSTSNSIWVTYVDGDGTVYVEKTSIAKGAQEPPAPTNPKRGGYVFDGWDRTVDENGNITYTARWKKTGTSTPSEVSERPLISTPLSETGETVGTAGMAALMLALLGGGLLALRRQRAMSEE